MKSRCIGKWTITKPTNDGSCRYITYDTSDVEEVRAAGRRGWGIAQHIEVDFGGDPTIEDRSQEEAAVIGYSSVRAKQEPVAIYHGNGIIDCGDAGHHNIELLKMIPAGAKLYKDPSAEIAALRERIAGIEKEAAATLPRVHGISRIADNPCALLLLLKREPTDDEVRGIHDAIAKEKRDA